MTDLITSVAVKKVYRKATLCIHPDKVQQKGATIQQKYTAEKVFDILKVPFYFTFHLKNMIMGFRSHQCHPVIEADICFQYFGSSGCVSTPTAKSDRPQ